MIVTEYFRTRSDGVVLIRTYSDADYMIERDGVRYSEAIDPEEMGRIYTETDELIKTNEIEELISVEMQSHKEQTKEEQVDELIETKE